MDATDLEPWGEGLDDRSLGQALAALGVWMATSRARDFDEFLSIARTDGAPRLSRMLADRRRLPWDIGPVLRAGPAGRRALNRAAPASVLAASWSVTVWQRWDDPVRLEVAPEWDDTRSYAWLVRRLVDSDVRAAPFVPQALTASAARLQWPIRLGLLDGPEHDSLRTVLLNGVGWEEHVEWVRVEGADTPCDLLFLESTPDDPLDPLVSFADPMDVGAILAFAPGFTSSYWPIAEARRFLQRNEVDAWGVGLLDIPISNGAQHIHEIIRTLAHDSTLDVALAKSTWDGQTSPPVLLAQPRSLEEARVSHFGRELLAMLPTVEPGGDTVMVSGDVAQVLEVPPGPLPRVVLENLLETRENFAHEDQAAEAVSRMAKDALESARQKPVAPRPRRIQAQVFKRHGRSRYTKAEDGVLRPDADYQLEVSIRYAQAGRVQAGLDLDLTTLPQDQRRHSLDVVFQELGTNAPAKHRRIEIRGDEESTATRFSFHTSRAGPYRARIIVSFRNRILQMVRFEATVRAAGANGARAGRSSGRGRRPQRLIVESSPRASVRDLGHRRTFDFAIVANHDVHGHSRAGVLKGKDYSEFGIPQPVADTIAWFEDTLTTLNSVTDKLFSKRTQSLLRELARAGHVLYEHLQKLQVDEQFLKPKHGRIQVVAGDPDAFFPVELVYDRGYPNATAMLCGKAREALLDGRCPEDCPPAGQELNVICPLGFWCLSRVIERHAYLAANGLDPNSYAFLAEPVTGGDELRPLAGFAYAASARADAEKNGSVALVSQALRNVTKAAAEPVARWFDWEKAIQTAPSMLVIICHTEQSKKGLEPLELEIGRKGNRPRLDINAIDFSHVLGPKRAPRPLVLLIGCSTGVQRVPFENVVSKFALKGAAIVLSTLSTVMGAQAADVTVAVINKLAQASHDPKQKRFGDVMLEVRRELLAEDVTMVLALASFGDADWRLAHVP